MGNLIDYARSELELAFPNETDGMQLLAMRNVMELIEKFCEQKHSGLSATYVLRLFDRLVKWNPIKPLTGEDDEWGEPFGDEQTQQNKRCSKVFRDHFDNSTAINVEGKFFVDEDGYCYTCRESSVPVTFPYEVPDKPEYVQMETGEIKHNDT